MSAIARLSVEEQHRYVLLKQRDRRFMARTNFLDFVRYTMPKYRANWHHRVTANKLNDVAYGRCRRLILLMPPQHGKSELGSHRFPAFFQGLYPDAKILCGSYNKTFASDIALDVAKIIDSEPYHELFPRTWVTPEGNASIYKRNNEGHQLIPVELEDGSMFVPGGAMSCQGIGGTFTGKGARLFVIDDPFKNRKEADSAAHRKDVWDWYSSTARTRLSGMDAAIVIIMTPWHEADLAHLLMKISKENPDADRWEVVKFPAIRETMDNPEDPRQLGEVLWPERYPLQFFKAYRAEATPRDWSALYQQSPTPLEGHIFKRHWFNKRYTEDPAELAKEMDVVILTADLTFKDTAASDYVALQVWGKKDSRRCMLDRINERMGFGASCNAIAALVAKWPMISNISLEDAANSAAVKEALTKKFTGVTVWKPGTSKVARAEVCSPKYIAGNVEYPLDKYAPWMPDYMEQLIGFPTAANDDEVDASTQALIVLGEEQQYDWEAISITKPSGYR